MPFWRGPRAGRPLEFGRAIGALCGRLRALPEDKATRLLVEKHSLSEGAARNLLQYLRDQGSQARHWSERLGEEAAGAVPDDRTIVVERYLDEIGDWRVCILSPFGSQVHAPWAMAIASMVGQAFQPALAEELPSDPSTPNSQSSTPDINILWTDDGIVARFPEADEPPPAEALLPDPDEVEDLVIRQLGAGGGRGAALGTARRHWERGRPVRLSDSCAGASALGPGSCDRLPHGSRGRAADLLRATARYGDFPIVLEAYCECLRDDFNMPALVELLRAIGRREIRVVTVNSPTPSP